LVDARIVASAHRIHLIVDNYGIHSARATLRALEELGGRIVLHFLPPYCLRSLEERAYDISMDSLLGMASRANRRPHEETRRVRQFGAVRRRQLGHATLQWAVLRACNVASSCGMVCSIPARKI